MKAQEIDRALAETKAVGFAENGYLQTGNVHVYGVTDSTMNRAADLIAEGVTDATFILARLQTAGVGSGDHKWASPAGNVFLTVVTKILPDEFAQEMEMIAACATAEIIQEALPEADRDKVSVKYPNDIRINEVRAEFKEEAIKCGGCLAPPRFDFPRFIYSERMISVGIGVNLRVAPTLPDGRITTSLKDHDITMSVGEFVEKFEKRFSEILTQYREAKDFRVVLNRMGFLDKDGMMPLTDKKSREVKKGYYAGFTANHEGGKDIAKINLRERSGFVTSHLVHDYEIISTPGRHNPSPAQPRYPDARPG